MTDITTPTADDLQAQLAVQLREVEDAERAAGAAQLDNQDEKGAAKRLQEARNAVSLTEAALGELERRGEARAEREAERDVARRRQAGYEWAAEYFRRMGAVLRGMDELNKAERHLAELRTDARVYDRRLDRDRLDDQGGGGFDMTLIDRLPFSRKGLFPASTVEDFETIQRHRNEKSLASLNQDECLANAEWAERLAAAEAESTTELEGTA